MELRWNILQNTDPESVEQDEKVLEYWDGIQWLEVTKVYNDYDRTDKFRR